MLLSMPFSGKAVFIFVVLVSSLLPDIDSASSCFGKKIVFRPLQFFVKHRGVLHSFTFLFFVSYVLYIFYPSILVPFILGYGGHLLADMVTVAGIVPFWPLRIKFRGFIRTGKFFENFLFFFLVLADIYFFGLLFF